MRLAAIQAFHIHAPWRKYHEFFLVLLEKLLVTRREVWNGVNVFHACVRPVAADLASSMRIEPRECLVVGYRGAVQVELVWLGLIGNNFYFESCFTCRIA